MAYKSIGDILNSAYTGNALVMTGNTTTNMSSISIAALSLAAGTAVAAAVWATAALTRLPVNIQTPVAITGLANPLPVSLPAGALSVSSLVALTTATVTVSPTIALVSVKIINANTDRKGLILYNNSANSVYLSVNTPATSGTNLFYILPTFTQMSLTQMLPGGVYTGAIYGIRNAGTGTVVATEFTL